MKGHIVESLEGKFLRVKGDIRKLEGKEEKVNHILHLLLSLLTGGLWLIIWFFVSTGTKNKNLENEKKLNKLYTQSDKIQLMLQSKNNNPKQRNNSK